MRPVKVISGIVLLILVLVGGVVLFAKPQTVEIAVPLLGDGGGLGAKIITIERPSGLLASTLVKIRGGSTPRDAWYHTLTETQNGQLMIHGPAAPDDLHLADCAPAAPMTAPEVFQGVGPGDANAWGYRYADQNAVFETTCVKGKLNAVPVQAVDPCFLGAGAGEFFGQADNFAFVNPAGTLNIPGSDPFALVIASMKVVAPEIARNERCSKPSSPVCGDEFIDPPETCEDGNLVNGDGCSSTCQTTTECNDGVDNADTEDTLVDTADPGCHSDGNALNAGSYVPGDTSEVNVPGCGNGVLEAGEQCDDGNLTNGDGCSDICQTTTQCNDGVDNTDPEDTVIDCADPGCHSDANAANNTCVASDNSESNVIACPNGSQEGGEQCDDGNASNFDACLVGCVNNVCGDGYPVRAASVSAPGEACDDGKHCPNGFACLNDTQCGGVPGSCITRSGDGCSAACVTEPRFNCEWKSTLTKDECTIPLGGGV